MSEDCCAYLRDICLILVCSNKSIFEIDSYRFNMELTCIVDSRMISVPFDWLKFPFYTLVRLWMFMFRLMVSVMQRKCACNESSFFNFNVLSCTNYVEMVMTLLNTECPRYVFIFKLKRPLLSLSFFLISWVVPSSEKVKVLLLPFLWQFISTTVNARSTVLLSMSNSITLGTASVMISRYR
jgi:hypothetical protein